MDRWLQITESPGGVTGKRENGAFESPSACGQE